MTPFEDVAGTFEFATVPARVPLAEACPGVDFPAASRPGEPGAA